MSWKQYGGKNKLDNFSSLSVTNINTENVVLQNPYIGDLDISGNVNINQNLMIKGTTAFDADVVFENNLQVGGNIDISGSIRVEGNIISKSLNIENNIRLAGNLIVERDGHIKETLYLDPSDSIILHGDGNRKLGINTFTPTATLDICGNISNVLNVHSNQPTSKNYIVQNGGNKGIAVYTEATKSSIQFYNDSTTSSSTPNGFIEYNQPGILNIVVNDNTNIKSKLAVSNRNVYSHVSEETAVIYDISSGINNYDNYEVTNAYIGNSMSLIASDLSASTQLNIITSNKKGITIAGGAFPSQPNRSMGVIGYRDASSNILPGLSIISGNNKSKYRTTLGINTYKPKLDKYVFDINGPTRISNSQVKLIGTIQFESMKIGTNNRNSGSVCIVGSSSTVTRPATETEQNNRYIKYAYVSRDYGESWEYSRINPGINDPTKNNDIDIFSFKFQSGYTYDNSFTVIGAGNGFMFYTENGGVSWNQFTYINSIENDIDIKSISIDSSFVYFITNNSKLYYFANPYVTRITSINSQIDNRILSISISITPVPVFNSMYSYQTNIYIAHTSGIYTYTRNTGISDTGVQYNSANSWKYIHGYMNNIIAVGNDKIIYKKDNSNWNEVTQFPPNLPSGTVFNSVFVYDISNAIVVGTNGTILYSTDGYITWNYVLYDMIDDAGTAFILNKSSFIFNDIQMPDNNTFVITAVLQPFSISPTPQLGSSKVFYIHAPEIFNSVNNYVFDICGNMHISGDIKANRNIYLDKTLSITGNTESVNIDTGSLLLKGGAGISGNVNIGGNAIIGNTIYANTYNSNGGNIHIGSEGFSLLSRTISIGDVDNVNSNTQTQNIIIGGPNDIITVYGTFNTRGTVTNSSASGTSMSAIQVLTTGEFGGNVRITDTEESVNVNTGSLITNGGVSIKKNANIGGNVSIIGNTTITNTTSSTTSTTGALKVAGGVGIGENINVGGYARIQSQTSSNDSTTGALVVTGGVGIQGRLNISSKLDISDSTISTSSTSGSFTTSGGAGIVGNLYVGGVSRIESSINSMTVESGALIVSGGVGIAGNVNMAGNLKTTSTLGSTTTSNGALVVSGGAGINGNLNVGGQIKFQNTTQATDVSIGAVVINGGVGIGRKVFIGDDVKINSTTAGTSSTGALVVAGGISVSGESYFKNTLNITNSTESILSSNGALIVTGGVGIGKSINVGGNIKISPIVAVPSTSTDTGALTVNGGIGVNGNIYIAASANIADKCRISNTTFASTFNDGALTVSGGIGVRGDSYIGNLIVNGNYRSAIDVNTAALAVVGGISMTNNLIVGQGISKFTDTTECNSVTGSGSLRIAGGVGIAANTYIGGNTIVSGNVSATNLILTGTAFINSGEDSISTTSGAFTVTGGMGIGKSVNIGGNLSVKNTYEAVSSTDAAVVISGGVGIQKKLFVAGNVNISSSSDSISSSTGALIVAGGTTMNGANNNIAGNLIINTSTQSTSSNTGAVIIKNGGLGVNGNANIGGNISIGGNSSIGGNLQVSQNVSITKNMTSSGVILFNNTIDTTSDTSGTLLVTGGVGIGGNIGLKGAAYMNSQTDSTSISTGAVIVAGGIGVSKNITANTMSIVSTTNATNNTTGPFKVAGGIAVGGNSYIGSVFINKTNEASTSTSTGTVIVDGGMALKNAFYTSGNVNIANSTAYVKDTMGTGAFIVAGGTVCNGGLNVGSTSTVVEIKNTETVSTDKSSGTIIVTGTGGIGVGGNINSNRVSIASTNDSSTTTNAALYVAGGATIVGTTKIGNVVITGITTDSTSSTSGTITITGGAGVSGNVNIGGNTKISSSTASSSKTVGALVVTGGIGVGAKSYITDLVIDSTTDSTNKSTGALVVNGGAGIAGNVNIEGNTTIAGKSTFTGLATFSGGLSLGSSDLSFASLTLSSTAAGGSNTGALKITTGGAYIVGSVYIGAGVDALSYNARSDYRIKKEIRSLDSSFTIDDLNPVTYTNTITNKTDCGLIAHEVQEIYPFLVNGEKDGKEYQSVNYTGIIPILINEIKKLKKEISELKNSILPKIL